MKKQLSEMTLEELWELFPIILTEHQACWRGWYLEEAQRIQAFLSIPEMKLHHIGSTSIEAIWAKPIIDIMLEISKQDSMEEAKEIFIQNGYICMHEELGRKSFNRGYTIDGFADRVFHLHLRYIGDNDELYFRDYMKEHVDLAAEYEKMKLSLWKQYKHNRDGYTEAKGAFIRKYTEEAKREYGERYSENGGGK